MMSCMPLREIFNSPLECRSCWRMCLVFVAGTISNENAGVFLPMSRPATQNDRTDDTKLPPDEYTRIFFIPFCRCATLVPSVPGAGLGGLVLFASSTAIDGPPLTENGHLFHCRLPGLRMKLDALLLSFGGFTIRVADDIYLVQNAPPASDTVIRGPATG